MPTNDDDQRLETCDELDEVHSVQQQDNTHLVLLATPKPTADPSTSLGKRCVVKHNTGITQPLLERPAPPRLPAAAHSCL